MSKKYAIQVRRYVGDALYGDFTVVETVTRVLRAEQIGNFNPFFCRYKNDRRVLVHSDAGDLSDPFRREESYAETFYIKVQS